MATEWVSIKDAAERLGVSADTIRRRMKRGELASRKQPTAQGYVWEIEAPAPEASVESPEPVQDLEQAEHLELVQLRERVAGLERERGELIAQRDAWQEQARRSSDAEAQLRELVARAQMLAQALPAAADSGAERMHRTEVGVSDSQSSQGTTARSWWRRLVGIS